MRAAIIIAAVLALLWLASWIRLGVSARYGEGGILVRVRVGVLRITLFPVKKKPPREKKVKKEKKRKEPKKKSPEPEQEEKRGGSLELFRQFFSVVTDAAGQFRKKLRIDHIELALTWASPNPAATAMGYGAANAAIGMFWPLLAHNFNIKEHSIRTAADFNRTDPVIYVSAALTMTVGQAMALGLRVGIKAFGAYRRYKKEGET